MTRMAWIGALVAAGLLAGCGIKGDLEKPGPMWGEGKEQYEAEQAKIAADKAAKEKAAKEKAAKEKAAQEQAAKEQAEKEKAQANPAAPPKS